MDKKQGHILVIISCAAFWVGSMVWTIINEPEIYYKPLAVMIFCSLFLIKEYAIKQGRFIYVSHWFFFILSITNVVKELFFKPMQFSVNDYIFPFIAFAIAYFKFKKYHSILEKHSK